MNSIIGDIEIELNGKKFVLRPDFEALMLSESLSGRSLAKTIELAAKSEFLIRDYTSIIYACHKSYSPDTSETFQSIGSAFVAESNKNGIFFSVLSMINRVMLGDKKKEEAQESRGEKQSE